MAGPWVKTALAVGASLGPLIQTVAKEGAPALGEGIQNLRENARDSRSRRKEMQVGRTREVLDPVLDCLAHDDWSAVDGLMAELDDVQLKRLRQEKDVHHAEIREAGGPHASRRLTQALDTELARRRAAASSSSTRRFRLPTRGSR